MNDDTRGSAEVLRILLVVQAGAGLLASLGEVVLMASPIYAVVPILKAALLLVLAAAVSVGRRWALVTTIVVEILALVGVSLSMVVALVPSLSRTMTLTGLLTEVALPLAAVTLAAIQLTRTRRPVPAGTSPQWMPGSLVPVAGPLATLPACPPAPVPAGSPHATLAHPTLPQVTPPHPTLRLPEWSAPDAWPGDPGGSDRTLDLPGAGVPTVEVRSYAPRVDIDDDLPAGWPRPVSEVHR